MKDILEIKNLKIRFDRSGNYAVNDISIAMKEGEIIGIIGESGSGKSVTAKSIMQLLPPNGKICGGRIYFDGTDIMELSESEMTGIRGAKIAYLLQNPMASFNPVKKIGAPLAKAAKKQNPGMSRVQIKDAVIEMLRDVGLENAEEVMGCYPHQLSGGMLQRAAIAVALSREPDVLIADEPTTALDASVQEKILELLRTINRKRRTSIILISHNIYAVRKMCSRIYVMQKGRIVESGNTEEILASPKHEYTQRLLDSVIHFNTPKPEEGAAVNADPSVILEVTDVSKSYPVGNGRKQVLSGISFAVRKGHCLGLLGDSGCGKTTLAKCIAGILSYDSGSIVLHGTDAKSGSGAEIGGSRENSLIENCSREWKERVQLVMQDSLSSFDDRKTIRYAFEEVLKYHGIPDSGEAIRKVMDLVNLETEILDRYPGEISGGQCQRANIARALLLKPDIIIWDEPVSSMDTVFQRQLLKLLKKIQIENDLTYIFISHDLAVVKYFCDEAGVIRDGRIEACGPCEEILQEPA